MGRAGPSGSGYAGRSPCWRQGRARGPRDAMARRESRRAWSRPWTSLGRKLAAHGKETAPHVRNSRKAMGIFKNKDTVEEAAESGRMRPEDLLAPTPEKPEQAESGTDEAKQDKGEEVKDEMSQTEAPGHEPKGEAKGNPEQP